MKKIKVGFLLIDYHSGQGGLEKVLLQVMENLEIRGLKCTAFFLQAPKDDVYLNRLPHYKIMQQSNNTYPPLFPKFINRLIWKKNFQKKTNNFFKKTIAEERLDALVILDFSNGLLRIKPILEQYKLQKPKTSLILWPHMSCETLTPTFIKKTQNSIHIFDTIFAISNGLKTEFEQLYKIENIELLYNPVYFPDITPQRNPKKLLFLGRVNDPRKRIKDLLKALTNVRGNWKLDLIGGTGSNEGDKKFRQFISSLNLSDKVTLSGWTTTPWELVNDAGILLLNSTNEGFPLVLLEAMARGIPCISSNCKTGPNEIIHEGVNGWLYDVDDEQKLQLIIQEIINGERELPPQAQVIDSVQKFSEEAVIENFKDNILKTISNKYQHES